MIKLVRYSSKILTYNVTSVPDGTEIAEAFLTVKEEPSVLDSMSDIFKTITPTPGADGQVIDTGADTIGKLEFYIGPSDTTLLSTNQYYYVAVKIKLDNDEVYLLEESIEPARVLEFGIEQL